MIPEFDLENVQYATLEKGKSPVFQPKLMIGLGFEKVVIKMIHDNVSSISY